MTEGVTIVRKRPNQSTISSGFDDHRANIHEIVTTFEHPLIQRLPEL